MEATRRRGSKIRLRNAPNLDRARNRVRRARHGVARDFMAVRWCLTLFYLSFTANAFRDCECKIDMIETKLLRHEAMCDEYCCGFHFVTRDIKFPFH